MKPARRCAWCRRRFVGQRSTKRFCEDRCRDAAAHAAARARAPIPLRIPLAVPRVCPICQGRFYATIGRGSLPRYDRVACKRIAEKLRSIEHA